MPRLLRLVLAIVAGLLAGSALNMGLILLGNSVIPAPGGADTTTTEGLRASIHLFEPRHYLFPFLAHSLGTLLGAYVATRLAPGRPLLAAMIVGLCFLAGGVASVFMIPAAGWFIVLDLVVAYLPMAWLGWRLAQPRGTAVSPAPGSSV